MTINDKNLCSSCFAEIAEGSAACPVCGYDDTAESPYPTALPVGTVLLGQYVIGRTLGKGGFGVTYLAYDSKEEKKVAVKEYLPDSLIHRDRGDTLVSTVAEDKDGAFKKGAERFFEEAQMVSRFNGNPGLIWVYKFFYENNTAYFVMEYLEGYDLKTRIEKSGGTLTEQQVLDIINPLIDSLIIVHSIGVLHRDISPDNIYMTGDGKIKLIDFGAARQVVGEVSKSLSVILKQGFAPIEQYQTKGKQGPWTDIYALGATMYYCLTGQIPEAPMDRMESDSLAMPANISPQLQGILRKMMAIRAIDRYQDMMELKKDMQANGLLPGMATSQNAEAAAAPIPATSYGQVPQYDLAQQQPYSQSGQQPYEQQPYQQQPYPQQYQQQPDPQLYASQANPMTDLGLSSGGITDNKSWTDKIYFFQIAITLVAYATIAILYPESLPITVVLLVGTLFTLLISALKAKKERVKGTIMMVLSVIVFMIPCYNLIWNSVNGNYSSNTTGSSISTQSHPPSTAPTATITPQAVEPDLADTWWIGTYMENGYEVFVELAFSESNEFYFALYIEVEGTEFLSVNEGTYSVGRAGENTINLTSNRLITYTDSEYSVVEATDTDTIKRVGDTIVLENTSTDIILEPAGMTYGLWAFGREVTASASDFEYYSYVADSGLYDELVPDFGALYGLDLHTKNYFPDNPSLNPATNYIHYFYFDWEDAGENIADYTEFLVSVGFRNEEFGITGSDERFYTIFRKNQTCVLLLFPLGDNDLTHYAVIITEWDVFDEDFSSRTNLKEQ